jgi:DNA-binding NarL/FixJ family response regulator
MIRVLIADDEALVRGGIRMILDAQGDLDVVGEAAEGSEAVEQARGLHPDVLLMDIRMPGMDGLEATRRVLTASEETRVLILTTFDLDEYLYDAMRAGASGFLLKSAPPEQLVQAIRIVAGGEALLAPSITRRLVQQFVRRPRPGSVPPQLDELTEREHHVFKLIARGLSNAEIAEVLFLSEGTVKTHVNRILRKLSLRDRVQVVVLAFESGLVEPGATGESAER